MFFNLELVSKSLMGRRHDEFPGFQANMPGLNPREMIVGCHYSADDDTKRNFANGRFDELAFWAWKLNETERPKFLGGYSK